MNETLDYIESYFENSLTAEERVKFEQRITTDTAFASEVAFYVQARQALRQELIAEKEKSWQSAPEAVAVKPAPVIPIKKSSSVRRWISVAAGVIVVIGVSIIFLLSGPGGAVQMAQDYTATELQHLSPNMDASHDSLELGIAAYNAGNWNEAEKLFDGVYAAHPGTLNALKFSGYTAIQKKDYDKAISQFQKLTAYPDQNASPGPFNEALALLMRHKGNDKKQATVLLQQVVNENLPGHAKAAEMLKELNNQTPL